MTSNTNDLQHLPPLHCSATNIGSIGNPTKKLSINYIILINITNILIYYTYTYTSSAKSDHVKQIPAFVTACQAGMLSPLLSSLIMTHNQVAPSLPPSLIITQVALKCCSHKFVWTGGGLPLSVLQHSSFQMKVCKFKSQTSLNCLASKVDIANDHNQ